MEYEYYVKQRNFAMLLRFIARFARDRIEDSSLTKFALNGIQRDFFGGIFFPGGFSSGGFYPVTYLNSQEERLYSRLINF